jgi:glycosyltransferase involved in cell wall biosynthesis
LPLVSIGVPVYNEERFLDASLASLRVQDYPNLEIILSDNASTDGTLQICERHATEDARIRIERADENRGAIANFQHAFVCAKGEFFMWASGHDLWTPNLIPECVKLLTSNRDVCIAFGSSQWIDADGAPLAQASGWTDTRGMPAIARFFTIFWGNMHPVLGMMRTAQLRACSPMRNITGADLVLLSELALKGHFVHATQATWYRREFRQEPTYRDKLRRYASPKVAISKTQFQRYFPLLQLPLALIRVVLRASLPAVDKMLMLPALLAAYPLRYVVGRRGKSNSSHGT